MSVDDELQEFRKKINSIDNRILDLLSQRGRLAKEVWELKEKHDLDPYAANREKVIHQRLEGLNQGPLPNESIRTIFQEIISACLSLERPLKIAYLGPEATFTHQAALHHFGQSPQFVEVPTIEGIFEDVEKKRCDYGVVPVENSNEGSVDRTLDMFIETPLHICAEVSLVVSLYLLGASDKIDDVENIYSHPQALAQCSRWLANNLPEVPVHSVSSTAVAAKKAALERDAAAIASKVTASIYNLNIIREKIEDYTQNFTRFWVIGHQSPDKSGHDKTSLMFALKHEAGALYEAIYPFSKHRINMTKIESRPLKDHPWEYIFFADMEGHIVDKNIKDALKEIENKASFLKILGSYPRSS
jgi:chorismate mutase/prephenate dehydratase